MTGPSRPDVSLATRPLHFFLLVDCSGSMAAAGKMVALNTAVRELLPHLAEVASRNPHTELLVRVIAFSTGARWHIERPTRPDDIRWTDLSAHGYTDLGAAIDLTSRALTESAMPERAAPPALVLISDGMPTDDVDGALRRFVGQPWGARSIRMAVAIGRDADRTALARFIGDERVQPLSAANPEQLVRGLRWAGTQLALAASTVAELPTTPEELARPAVTADEVIW